MLNFDIKHHQKLSVRLRHFVSMVTQPIYRDTFLPIVSVLS